MSDLEEAAHEFLKHVEGAGFDWSVVETLPLERMIKELPADDVWLLVEELKDAVAEDEATRAAASAILVVLTRLAAAGLKVMVTLA